MANDGSQGRGKIFEESKGKLPSWFLRFRLHLSNKILINTYYIGKNINNGVSTSIVDGSGHNNELDSLISAFTSPVPAHILTDYENKASRRRKSHMDNESALEHLELNGPVFREFTIHIF